MKKIISSLIAVAIMAQSVTLWAANNETYSASVSAELSSSGGTCGENLTWTFENGALSINGEGAMTDYQSDSAPWQEYSVQITNVVIADGVTNIGDYAFYYCTNIESITLPSSVTTIGDYAFANCRKLASINLNNVASIGEAAFSDCHALAAVSLSDNLTYIGSRAFSNCKLLADIYYGNGRANWNTVAKGLLWDSNTGSGSADGTYTLHITGAVSGDCGSGVTWKISGNVLTISGTGSMTNYIASAGGAYYDADTASGEADIARWSPWYDYREQITSIVIESGVTNVGDYAFKDFTALTGVTFADSVTSIGKYAFNGCTSLANINLNSVATIGKGTFSGCSALASISIPASLTVISDDAFSNCINLATLNIAEGVTDIGNYAFYNCRALTSLTLPESMINIGDYAFYSCKNLVTVEIPISVRHIGDYAFANCADLATVNYAGTKAHWVATADGSFWSFNAGYNTASGTYTLNTADSTEVAYGYCGDDVVWAIDENGTLTIIGDGSMTDFASAADAPWSDYCDDITAIVIEKGLSHVGNNAFASCSNAATIYYDGSVEEWEAVTKGTDWDSGTGSATPYKSYTFSTYELKVLASGDCGATANTVTWKLTEDYTLTISGTGKMAAYSASSHAPWYDYSDKIKAVVIESGVTSITKYSFYNCSSLESIEISDTVTTVATDAFVGCSSLESITVPEGNTSLAVKDGVLFNKKMTQIYCFPAAKNVVSYTIPEGVTSIRTNAFLACTKLTQVTLPSTLSTISIYAFRDCSNLAGITIPASVTTIYYNAFLGCNSLTAITVDASNTAFTALNGVLYNYDKTALVCYPAGKTETEFTIPGGVETINKYSFIGCDKLSVISIPVSVTTIDTYAFADCTALAEIRYDGSQTDWDAITVGSNWANNAGSATEKGIYTLVIASCSGTLGENLGWVIGNDGTLTISGSGAIDSFNNAKTPWDEYSENIKSVVIGNGITSIGDYVFTSCKNLESVTIGNDVTAIGKHAFVFCNNLASIAVSAGNTSFESVDGVLYNNDKTTLIYYPGGKADTSFTVPTGVTTIISYAMRSANNLTSVTLPDSVTTIGNYAFWGSENIETVTIGSGVTAIGAWAFAYCDSLTAIDVSEENEKYASADGVLYTADMKTLVSYPIGKTATAFAVPDGVKRICNYAFYGCDSLVTITLSASVNNVGNSVFNYCGSLTAIEVNAENTKYASADGVLYTADMATLLYYPAGKTDTEFDVPETVTSIGRGAFENCDNLVTVNVGTNVTKLGYASFAYCDKLANIKYAGSESGWNEIAKGSYWNRHLDGDEVKYGA